MGDKVEMEREGIVEAALEKTKDSHVREKDNGGVKTHYSGKF